MTMTVMKASWMHEHLHHRADRRFRSWEDVVLDSFACNNEDYPVTRQNKSDITAVELAALHHEVAVDPLHWFADFATEKHRHSSDAENQQLQGLIQIWYTAGTYDKLNGGGKAAMEDLARQIQSYFDANSNTTGVGQIRVFTLDPDELETPWYRLFGGSLPLKSSISRKLSPLSDASVDVSGGMLVVQAATVLCLGAKSRLRDRMVLDVAKLTRASVEVVGRKEGQWRGVPPPAK